MRTRNLLVPALLLAQLPAQGYLVDSNLDQLFSVDLATGNVTLIGSTANNGLTTPADLAWKPDTSELWTIDLGGGEVGTLDTTNGTFTPVYQTNMSGWQGLAYDNASGNFYLVNQTNPDLYVLDTTTGMTTLVGDTTLGLITCVDFDGTGQMFGIDFFNGQVVRIDKNTAAATTLSTTNTGFQGLGVDANGTWYGANTNDDSLYTIDLNTGVATIVGVNPGIQFAKGFEIPDAGVFRAGSGCRDSGGVQLTMNWMGAPQIGTSMTFSCDVQPSGVYFLLVGLSDTTAPFGSLPLDLGALAPGCTLYQSSDLSVGPFPQGQGLQVMIPNVQAIVGASVYVQGAEVDPGLNPLGFALSDYLTVTILP